MTTAADPHWQPTLEGALVVLRPVRDDDFDALYRVANDPLLWAQHPAHDRWREPQFRAFFADAIASRGALVALDADTGEVIGSSRFHGHDPAARTVEIGWTFVARSRWGGVVNGEMKRLMLAHAFERVDTVHFVIGERNLRSRRAVEKIGAVRIDAPAAVAAGGRVMYAITRERFVARAAPGERGPA